LKAAPPEPPLLVVVGAAGVVGVGVAVPPVEGAAGVGVGVTAVPPVAELLELVLGVVVVEVDVVEVVLVVALPAGVVVPPDGGAVRTGVVLGRS
jgi:hypothetical protein